MDVADQIFVTELKKDIAIILNNLIQQLKNELSRQGHVRTGKLRDSLELRIKDLDTALNGGVIDFELYAEDYWRVLNDGVSAASVRGMYKKGSGRSFSKYIAGLRNFFRSLGFTTGRANKRLAFATANIHRREGVPSKGAQKYSSVNRRRGFANVVLGKEQQVINRRVERSIVNNVEKYFINKFAL